MHWQMSEMSEKNVAGVVGEVEGCVEAVEAVEARREAGAYPTSSVGHEHIRSANEMYLGEKRSLTNKYAFWNVHLGHANQGAVDAVCEADVARNSDGFNPDLPDSAYMIRMKNCMQRAADWSALAGHCRFRLTAINGEIAAAAESGEGRQWASTLLQDSSEEVVEVEAGVFAVQQKRKLHDLEINCEVLMKENKALKATIRALVE